MAQHKEREMQRTGARFSEYATRSYGEPLAPTAGGPPDLPVWYRERQFDLFGLPLSPEPKDA